MLAPARGLSKTNFNEIVLIAQIVANGFTKELTPAKHSEFIKQLNMVDVGHMLSLLIAS